MVTMVGKWSCGPSCLKKEKRKFTHRVPRMSQQFLLRLGNGWTVFGHAKNLSEGRIYMVFGCILSVKEIVPGISLTVLCTLVDGSSNSISAQDGNFVL
jgi:hypothetical protein